VQEKCVIDKTSEVVIRFRDLLHKVTECLKPRGEEYV
jgi:hypothetical protein